MKKLVSLVLTISIILSVACVLPHTAFAADTNGEKEIRILLNNKFLMCEQPPVLDNGRTLVPMRVIFEALGAEVSWDAGTKTAIGIKDGKKVSLTIGKNEIVVDGKAKSLDVPAKIINDKTMIPVRAVAEAFDCTVNWNGYKRYVVIIPNNQKPYRVEVIDESSNVIGTAKFNDKGQLTLLTGKGIEFLTPFFANIAGNTFFDMVDNEFYRSKDDAQIKFLYNNVGDVIKIDCTEGDDRETYSITLTNGVPTEIYNNGGSIKYTSKYKYYDDICESDQGLNGATVVYNFDENGFIKTFIDIYNPWFERNYSYNEYGQLIYEDYNGMFFITKEYSYDKNNKLTKACHTWSQPDGKEITLYEYKYIEE